MSPEIVKKYQNRQKKTEERLSFNVKTDLVTNGAYADIVKVRDYYGLSKVEQLILLPAFDEIIFSDDDNLAYCRIDALWTIFNAATGLEVLPESLPKLPIYNDAFSTLELVVDDSHHGIYDISSHKLILDAIYDEVDPCTAYSHLWVRKGNQWGFVDKVSKEEALLTDMTMAFEADCGRFLQYRNKIIALDDDGHVNSYTLRQYVIANQGRGEVYNAKYHITVFFDVYGNILK